MAGPEIGTYDKFLKRMADDPSVTVSDISRLTGMSRKSVSRAISVMTKDELIRLLLGRLDALEGKVRALEYALIAVRGRRDIKAVSREKVGGNGETGIRASRT